MKVSTLGLTIVYHYRDRGLVRILRYDTNGRRSAEEEYNNIRMIVIKAPVLLPQGMHHNLTVYVIEGDATVKIEGSMLLVEKPGEGK